MTRLWFTGALFPLALFACGDVRPPPDVCSIASAPDRFLGRSVVVEEVIIADGHGDPVLVPDADCSAFEYFDVKLDKLPVRARADFTSLLRNLNRTTIDGQRAGIFGRYNIVLRKGQQPPVWSAELLNANNVKVVSAESKNRALLNQMPASDEVPQ